jgi:predicted nuclease with TOPRIM domain
MFNRTFIIHDNHALDAARKIAASNAQLADKMAEISSKEIDARSRVDITIAEYERMKNQISELSDENSRLKKYFEKLSIPSELPIIPGTIHRCYSEDAINHQYTIRVEFKVDRLQMDPDLIRKVFYT